MLITQHDCCKNKSVGFNFLFRNHYFSLYDYINCYTLLLKQWNRGSIFCFLLLTLLFCLSELTACFGCVGFVGCFILFQEELLKCCCGLGFNLSLLLALKEKKKWLLQLITIRSWGLCWMICLSPQCAGIPVCIYLVIFFSDPFRVLHWILDTELPQESVATCYSQFTVQSFHSATRYMETAFTEQCVLVDLALDRPHQVVCGHV